MRLSEIRFEDKEGYLAQIPLNTKGVIRVWFTPAAKLNGLYVNGEFFSLTLPHEGLGEAARRFWLDAAQPYCDALVYEEVVTADKAYQMGRHDLEAEQAGTREAREAAKKAYDLELARVRKEERLPVLYLKTKKGFVKAPAKYQLPRL